MTCTFYNVPREVAASTILSMKDLIIKNVKADNFSEAHDLLYSLEQMQSSYNMMLERGEAND